MFHEKLGWAKCGHETSYLTKDNASFEPERCDACLREYFSERQRMFAAGYREPEIPEDEKFFMAQCGHLGERVMVDGRPFEPEECLDCFAARHQLNEPISPEFLDALAILGNLMHKVVAPNENDA